MDRRKFIKQSSIIGALSYINPIQSIKAANAISASEIKKPREIKFQLNGVTHGPLTALVRPSDYGQLIKPFVFVDAYKAPATMDTGGFGWHPHSGIATVSLILKGKGWVKETIGKQYDLHPGSLEVMVAGEGVWHVGGSKNVEVHGYQIWVALPPELEESEAQSYYYQNDEIPVSDKAKVLLGEYKSVASNIKPLKDLTLLDITLEKGEKWTFTPPKNQNILWGILYEGQLQTDINTMTESEMVIFEESQDEVNFTAIEKSRLILGAAEKSNHNLIIGRSSVHTNKESLKKGERKINNLYHQLKQQGEV